MAAAAPRFPTQNHNRIALSKGDANHRKPEFSKERRRGMPVAAQCVWLFFHREQNNPPAEVRAAPGRLNFSWPRPQQYR